MARTTRKKKETEPEMNYPEFHKSLPDGNKDLETTLILCSNNGSDKKKYLHNARKRRMDRPILLEINCEETSYKINNYALSVDDAKQVVEELQKMIEYLEEI
jgi:hypothetical protein